MIGIPNVSRPGDYWLDYPIDFKLGLLAPYMNNVEKGIYCPGFKNEGKEIWPVYPGWTARREFSYGANLYLGGVSRYGPFSPKGPVRYGVVKRESQLIAFGDQPGGRWYIVAPSWGGGGLINPVDRHPGPTANWLFLDGHAKAGSMDNIWKDENMIPDHFD
jgi:prepilin-type processing-associated H-X9-DG protein